MGRTLSRRVHVQAALAACVFGVACLPQAYAADQTKADNTTTLNLPGSWVGGAAVPTAADLAIFDATLVTNSTFSLGDNVQSWRGIKLLNPASNITISAGNLLTLGTGGIDMTAATANLSLNSSLTLTGVGQTWDTGTTSKLLTVAGPLALGTGTLTTQGAGNVSISGNISGGAGNRIIQNGAGNLLLSGTNSFGNLTFNAGVVQLGKVGALPAGVAVTGTGGAVDLNGFNATIASLTGAAGIVTDNSSVAGTTSLTVNQAANTTFSGNLNNGPTRVLSLVKANGGSFTLSGANTYSGGTAVNQGFLIANSNGALGTGDVTVNTTGSAISHVHVNGGISIANNITVNATIAGAGSNGVIMYGTGTGNATISGTVTFAGPNVTQGGDIVGAATAGTFLNFTGPLVFAPGTAKTFIIVRDRNVMFSGGGNYPAIDLRQGTTFLGANNGIATTAVVDTAGNNAETWDLNGFNQTIVGLKNTVNATLARTVTNSAAGFSTLTFAPTSTGNFTFGGGSGVSTMSGNLNIVLNGDPAGVQAFGTNASSYVGSTTITSGILSISAINDGGFNSSLGAATSDQANLVFNGGTLRYTGVGETSNRDFTINNGKTANIQVATATSIMTLTGGTPTATTGGLTKLGPGTLVLTGTHNYTGNTTVSNGTLQINGSLAAGSTVTVSAGASLIGTGNIQGVVNTTTAGILAPGASVGTLTVGGLTLNGGSVTNLEFNASANDRITVSNAGGLTLNGANVNLLQEGTNTAFATNGTYQLIGYNTSFGGALGNIGITNPQAGKIYTLTNNTGTHTIDLSISDGIISEWQNPAGSAWTTGANWNNGIPNAIGVTPKFGSNLTSAGAISLNGAKTVGGLIFDNFNTYTIGTNADPLTIDNGAGAAIGVVTGSHIIAAPVILNSAVTVTSAGAILTISGNISGSKGLSLNGSGTMFLTGNNSYSTTNVNGGTLNIGDSGTVGTLGTGDVTIAATATLSINRSNTITVANNIGGASGNFNAGGSGTIILTGTNTFGTAAGGLIINGSTVKAGSAGAIPNGVLLIANVGALDLNGFNATVADLSGGANISDSSAGPGTTTLTLVGVNSGFFAAGINNGAAGRVLSVVKRDLGTATLAAASTYSGGTSLLQGVLSAQAAGALGTGDVTMGVIGSNVTRLDVGGNLSNNIIINGVSPGSGLGSINGTAGAVISGNITVNVASPGGAGHISGPGSGVLEITGKINSSASLIIRNGNVRLSGGGSYAQLQIQQGTTSLGANDGIPTTTAVAMGTNGNANLDLNGFNQTLASIVQVVSTDVVTNTGAPANFTLNTAVDDVVGGGLSFQGSLTLIKTGPAMVSLSAANSYTGQTTINQGILSITANNNLGAPATGAQVNFNGGTLQTGGNFALENGTNGNSRNISLLAGGGTFDLTAANTLTISGIISGAGALNLTAGKLVISGAASYTGTTSIGATGTIEYSGSVSHNTGLFLAAGAVQIDPAATVNIKANTSLTGRTNTLGALNLSGTTGAWTSFLNLANNNAIIAGGVNVPDQIKQAAHLGAWNGTGGGITSTSALAAATGSTATALGYATGADYTTGNGRTALDGKSFAPSDMLIMYTLAGDANLDASVTFADFLQLQNNYNKPSTNWEQGDWNYDGSTTFADFLILQNNYNKVLAVGSVLPSGGSGSAGAVPEPGSLLMLTLSSAALLARRRRRSE